MEVWICEIIVDSALPRWGFGSAVVSLSSVSNSQGSGEAIFHMESSLPPTEGVGHGFQDPSTLSVKTQERLFVEKVC